MADFNRYIVTVEATEYVAPGRVRDRELTFSVAAVSHDTVDSALGLDRIESLKHWEVVNVELRNE